MAEAPHKIDVPLQAYLLTFSTYGTRLPGSEKGWVDTQHCIPGTPRPGPDPRREIHWQSRLNEGSWILDHEDRLLTLRTILEVCGHRGWVVHAVHVRTNHVHTVTTGDVKPERMLSDFKAYATRAFRSQSGEIPRLRYLTDHGSTRYLWNEASVKAAIEYVLNGQGARMACYPRSEETEEGFAKGSLTLPARFQGF
jgi:REP element-mobilizing transposase RayT